MPRTMALKISANIRDNPQGSGGDSHNRRIVCVAASAMSAATANTCRWTSNDTIDAAAGDCVLVLSCFDRLSVLTALRDALLNLNGLSHASCSHSFIIRFARVRASSGWRSASTGWTPRLVEERVWDRREAFLALNPAGTTPVLMAEGSPADAGSRHRSPNSSTRPTARLLGEHRLLPQATGRPHRSAPAAVVVQRQILRRSQRPAGDGAHLQAVHDAEQGGGAPSTDVLRAAHGQCPLSSGLYRLAGADARFAGRRPADLCRSCRGRASVGDGLSGRCAMERRRRSEGMVRADQIPPVVPPVAERMAGGRSRRPRTTWISTSEQTLLDPIADQDRADPEAHAHRLQRDRHYAIPTAPRAHAERLQSVSRRRVAMATWTGSPTTRSAAPIRACCGATCARSSCWA